MVPPAMHPEVEGEGYARPQIVTVQARSCTCQVDAEMRAALGPLLMAEDPAAWPTMEEVKASPVRRILRGELPTPDGGGLCVHIKLFRAVRLSDHARDALTGSRATAEFKNLLEARARSLPAVRPLAAGSFRGSYGSRSFLVTQTVPSARALPRGPLSEEGARAAGRLLRQAHDAGLHAPDLHPGNVLLGPEGRAWLLDLTSAQFAESLETPARARALAFFCQDLDGGATDPRAEPLMAAYGAVEEISSRLMGLARRLRHRALSAFGRRAFRSCRHTLTEPRVKGEPRWFLYSPAVELHGEARQMADAMETLPPHKTGRRGAVFLGERIAMKSRTAAAARRLFQAAYWLTFAGVPCPEPIGLRLHMGRGAVLVRRLPGPTLAEEMASGSMGRSDVIQAARHLGEAVGRLHAHGLRNRDLKLENLIRDPKDNRVSMLDLDGIHRKTVLDRRGQGADLGRLLAAFRSLGQPEVRVVGAFLHGYNAARRCLLVPSNKRSDRHLRRLSAERANAWASAHMGSSRDASAD